MGIAETAELLYCSKRGLSNVTIITCDMNVFNADSSYDRILSIEMFEVGSSASHTLHSGFAREEVYLAEPM